MNNVIVVQFGDGATGTFPVRSIGTGISENSGRPVKHVTATASGSGRAVHEDFQKRLSDAPVEGFAAADPETGEQKHWTIRVPGWTERNGDYDYTLELDEREDLQIETLIMNGMEFNPTRYRDSVSKGIVDVTAQVTVDAAGRDQLRQLMDRDGYFPVIRRGINDSPVEMRFGLCSWSEHGDKWKYLFRLVDKLWDDAIGPPTTLNVWNENRDTVLVFRAGYVDEILSLLVAKGVLTDAEVAQAKQKAEADEPKRRHNLLQAVDVDQLQL
jgi:hypothetical protein